MKAKLSPSLVLIGSTRSIRDTTGRLYRYGTYKCCCGVTFDARISNVKSGNTKSCGCHKKITTSIRRTTHGSSKTTAYFVFVQMIQRCLNPNHKQFPSYGGRGIRVCCRWLKFENFIKDMGRKPTASHSLDRIDNDGDYSPRNCRWATASEQNNNKRNNVLVEVDGITRNVAQWATMQGASNRHAIYARLRRGHRGKAAVFGPRSK